MSSVASAGDLTGILLQLVGAIVFALAGYAFVESAIKATPIGGWLLACAVVGIVSWPLVATHSGAFSFQTGLATTSFATAGYWFWIGCAGGVAPLASLVCLAMRFQRLWRTALGLAAGAALIGIGAICPLLGRLIS